MKEFYFPPLVWEKIISSFPPLCTEERKIWDALRQYYITKSQYNVGDRRKRDSLISFRHKRLKNGSLSLFKYKATRFPYTRSRGLRASLEVERCWFLRKGFTETENHWEYWEEDSNLQWYCVVRIRKGMLHAIHSCQKWFLNQEDPLRPRRRRYYRTQRGRSRVQFGRYQHGYICYYNRNYGDFV